MTCNQHAMFKIYCQKFLLNFCRIFYNISWYWNYSFYATFLIKKSWQRTIEKNLIVLNMESSSWIYIWIRSYRNFEHIESDKIYFIISNQLWCSLRRQTMRGYCPSSDTYKLSNTWSWQTEVWRSYLRSFLDFSKFFMNLNWHDSSRFSRFVQSCSLFGKKLLIKKFKKITSYFCLQRLRTVVEQFLQPFFDYLMR